MEVQSREGVKMGLSIIQQCHQILKFFPFTHSVIFSRRFLIGSQAPFLSQLLARWMESLPLAWIDHLVCGKDSEKSTVMHWARALLTEEAISHLILSMSYASSAPQLCHSCSSVHSKLGQAEAFCSNVMPIEHSCSFNFLVCSY